MRAVRIAAPGTLELVELPDPTTGPGAVMAVDAVGVCASDRMMLRDAGPWPVPYPVQPGHEVVGTVEHVDDASAARWQVGPGTQVAVEVMVPCGRCHHCAAEDTHLCRDGAHLGSELPGGMAERMVVPPRARVWRTDGVPPAAVGVIEPVACAVHAVRRLAPRSGDVVVVTGLGGIGAAAVAVAAARGSHVVSLLRRRAGASLARRLGAQEVVVAEDDLATVVAAAVGPVDGVLEATGAPAVAAAALEIARPGGTVVLYGVYPRRVQVDLNLVAEFKELTVRGGHLAPHGAFGRAIGMLADGSVPGAELVTHRHPLDDAATAFAPVAPGDLRVRAVLEPQS